MSVPKRSYSDRFSESRQPMVRRPRSARRSKPAYQTTVVEVGLRLVVNSAVIAIAGFTAVRLVSANRVQQQSLRDLRVEAQKTQQRVADLKQTFMTQFDSHQTPQLMRQQGHRVGTHQVQIILTEPSQEMAQYSDAQE